MRVYEDVLDIQIIQKSMIFTPKQGFILILKCYYFQKQLSYNPAYTNPLQNYLHKLSG